MCTDITSTTISCEFYFFQSNYLRLLKPPHVIRPARQGIAIGVAQVAAELLFPHICTFSNLFKYFYYLFIFTLNLIHKLS